MSDNIEAQKLVALQRIATALEGIESALIYSNKCMSADGKLLIDATGSRLSVKNEV